MLFTENLKGSRDQGATLKIDGTFFIRLLGVDGPSPTPIKFPPPLGIRLIYRSTI